MVRIFWRRDYSVQQFFTVSVVAVVLGYGVASAYFYNYVGWVSWVGPLLGAVTGFVIDLVRKNPMLVHEKPAPVTRTEINVTVVSSSATFLGATRDGAEDDLGG
jgi:hypothetical protein